MHLVAADNEDVAEVYTTIREELGKYDKTLLTREEIVVLSKVDMIADKKEIAKKIKALEKASKKDVITLSLYEDHSVKAFGDILVQMLERK